MKQTLQLHYANKKHYFLSVLLPNPYNEREHKEKNDEIRHYIHWKICKYYEILLCKNGLNTS